MSFVMWVAFRRNNNLNAHTFKFAALILNAVVFSICAVSEERQTY